MLINFGKFPSSGASDIPGIYTLGADLLHVPYQYPAKHVDHCQIVFNYKIGALAWWCWQWQSLWQLDTQLSCHVREKPTFLVKNARLITTYAMAIEHERYCPRTDNFHSHLFEQLENCWLVFATIRTLVTGQWSDSSNSWGVYFLSDSIWAVPVN